MLTSGRLQVDSTGPVGEAGNLHPLVRLQCILLKEWNATGGTPRPSRRAHCSALRVRILEHLENSIASASIYSQVTKGLRWMPWRQEPMKDASGCEKLRGAAEIALIRRCPNGETRLGSCPVTRA